MKNYLLFILFITLTTSISAQTLDSIQNRLDFETDFRFRVEHDWNSLKSNGLKRTDRSRLRYRLRFGAKYTHQGSEIGFRIRTGTPLKQQDPQLTLGDGFKEFGTLPLGFEKVYFKHSFKNSQLVLGKNTFPFKKNNELFWSDNVFPEGVSYHYGKAFSSSKHSIGITAGHFIIATNGRTFNYDAALTAAQLQLSLFDKRISLFPGFFNFINIPNFPDGASLFALDYQIFNLGSSIKPFNKIPLKIEYDFLYNISNYEPLVIAEELKNQKQGHILAIKYGEIKKRKDMFFACTYAYLEKYAAVDFLAQNDWARWDYSSVSSPDGRLTNLHGIELVAAYGLTSKINLVAKYYLVEQLIAEGIVKETGSRFRIDINFKM